MQQAVAAAHRLWDERMRKQQAGSGIRVVSTDMLAMRAKVRRPRMNGGR